MVIYSSPNVLATNFIHNEPEQMDLVTEPTMSPLKIDKGKKRVNSLTAHQSDS